MVGRASHIPGLAVQRCVRLCTCEVCVCVCTHVWGRVQKSMAWVSSLCITRNKERKRQTTSMSKKLHPADSSNVEISRIWEIKA